MSSFENPIGQISIVKAIYMWEIKRDYITSKDIGEMLLSPEFQAINLKWQLQLKKIKGEKEEWEDLSIFLILVSLERSVEIRFLFSILNDRDENILSFPSSSVVFSRDKSKWGRKCIASSKLIERYSQILSDDKLKISCEIIPNSKALQSIGVSTGFENLLDNENFSDVTFVVKGKHLHAHKNILASKSKVFEAMFEHKMKENIENIVDVEDIEYDVLLEMFRFMYSGQVKDLEKHSKALLIAADKYDLIDLKVICDIAGGYLCFVISIFGIGVVTAVIGDVASYFGCTLGIKDSVTAIMFVALGTSIPDTFASKVAACQDKYADASVGNVTGSNAVNVFLGIGVAWSIAAIYHACHGNRFLVEPGSLAFSVTLFCSEACLVIVVLMMRRSKIIGGELGGPFFSKCMTSLFLFSLWVFYLVMSTLEAYGVIKGF